MVMLFNKILAKIIDANIKSTLSNNQQGGRHNKNTTTAKIQMAYNIKTKGYDKRPDRQNDLQKYTTNL